MPLFLRSNFEQAEVKETARWKCNLQRNDAGPAISDEMVVTSQFKPRYPREQLVTMNPHSIALRLGYNNTKELVSCIIASCQGIEIKETVWLFE